MAPVPGPATPLRRGALALIAGVVLLAVAIAVPLAWTWWQGKQAQASLEQAMHSLQDQDVDQARDHVEDARTYADRAVAAQHGVLGTMWRHLPILSAADDDAARLPEGYEVADLPEGWVEIDADTIAWGGTALIDSPSFEVTLSP